MAKMGFRKMNEMIGRCDLLEPANPLNDKVKVSQVNSPFVHLPQYTLFSPPPSPAPHQKKKLCITFVFDFSWPMTG